MVLVLAMWACAPAAAAADWPMWRYDAGRTAASPAALPEQLRLQWVLALPRLDPAWPAQDQAVTGAENLDIEDGYQRRMTFDLAYSPVVAGKSLYLGSSHDDSLRAYDTETGGERWRFYAEAPIRFAPVVAQGGVYFTSDDGRLYCLDAATGKLRWRFRGGPSDQRVLGNKRLGSAWPARGGPVVVGGTVYFAAGIWPFMGTFLHALDAETGNPVWINDGSGSIFMRSPHSGAWAFNAIAPQGYLAVAGDTLIVPNGRAVAAAFDLPTGALRYFWFGENNRNGTAHAAALGDYFQNSSKRFHLADGKPAPFRKDAKGKETENLTDGAILTPSTIYAHEPGGTGVIHAYSLTQGPEWSFKARPGTEVFCKAGDRIYAGSKGYITALTDAGKEAEIAWLAAIVGVPRNMIAADDKLFVATEEGYLYCYGATEAGVPLPVVASEKTLAWPAEDRWTDRARMIVEKTGEEEGYCLVLGVGTGRLMEELARQNPALNVIGIDPSPDRADALRRRWDSMGVPRVRLSIVTGDILTAGLPPYLANLVVSEVPSAAGIDRGDAFVASAFKALRPYGGKLCLGAGSESLLEQGVRAGNLQVADVRRADGFALLERVGALPDSADWSHQYADAANTVVSKDKRVRAPLGLLWYGGTSNEGILPRHRHGPTPQIVAGRLFIEGPDLMRAVDVYTGRLLWETILPGVGEPYVARPIFRDNEGHEPGANHLGSNYASAADGVYVAHGNEVLRLCPATGAILSSFRVPGGKTFAQVKIWEDLLIVTSDPLVFDQRPIGEDNWNATCSRNLVVMDRHSGEVRWQRTARHAFHHNTVVIGNGLLFCIDRLPPLEEEFLARRGVNPAEAGATYALLALDVATGQERWKSIQDVFGTWLGYSEAHDVLVQGGRDSADMVSGEITGRTIAYAGGDGSIRWDSERLGRKVERGPYLIHGRTLYMQEENYATSGAVDLLTGEVVMRTHPLTGESVPWRMIRNKGCGTQVACEHLMTFRSGAGGFYDLGTNGGVGNISGIKSGCTSNLIPADGVLAAPDYTRTCNCSYQNQTSLALVHMPEVETWTSYAVETPAPEAPILRAGINLGAYGDRMAEDGTLWMEYPAPKYGAKPGEGLTYPNLPIQTAPEGLSYFRRHSSWSAGGDLPWVTSSGAVGLAEFAIGLNNPAPRTYRIRLFFAEPAGARPGQRVFDVAIQGQQVLDDFDIAAASGGAEGRGVVREFRQVQAGRSLTIKLTPAAGAAVPQPVLCGVEIVAESGLGAVAQH